ncbi:MAG: hypothetical protein QW701_04085 [Candidatus Nezhaarchaeales archaeon]
MIGLRTLYKLNYDIVIFLDDDSYIVSNKFVELHEKWYEVNEVGGVAGCIIDVWKRGEDFVQIAGNVSIPPKRLYLWREPAIKILNRFIPQTYFTKGGYVAVCGNDTYHLKRGARHVFSLLGGGSNMSIRLAALSCFLKGDNIAKLLPNTPIAMRYEQILAYHIVKRGYVIVKDYNIKTYHIFREGGETRAPRNYRRSTITATDDFLYFYMKHSYPCDFSFIHKILAVIQRLYRSIVVEQKKSSDIELLLARLFGHLFGNSVGIWWSLSSNKEYVYQLFRRYESFMKGILKES